MDLTYNSLKAKQRGLRDGFPDSLAIRVHRALSWMQRAEQEANDEDAAFIFYWISFNAVYAKDANENEWEAYHRYCRKIVDLDTEKRLRELVWESLPTSVDAFLANEYVFRMFWTSINSGSESRDWDSVFENERRRLAKAKATRDTRTTLKALVDRLYVLRNQLVHGGATWRGRVNRPQVLDGARLMACLVPSFIDVMMDHPNVDWGQPEYPVVD